MVWSSGVTLTPLSDPVDIPSYPPGHPAKFPPLHLIHQTRHEPRRTPSTPSPWPRFHPPQINPSDDPPYPLGPRLNSSEFHQTHQNPPANGLARCLNFWMGLIGRSGGFDQCLGIWLAIWIDAWARWGFWWDRLGLVLLI